MSNDYFFLDENEIDAMKLKDGDKVKCISSTVPGREGKVFTVTTAQVGRKKVKDGIAPKWWLSHCYSYGDAFEKVD